MKKNILHEAVYENQPKEEKNYKCQQVNILCLEGSKEKRTPQNLY